MAHQPSGIRGANQECICSTHATPPFCHVLLLFSYVLFTLFTSTTKNERRISSNRLRGCRRPPSEAGWNVGRPALAAGKANHRFSPAGTERRRTCHRTNGSAHSLHAPRRLFRDSLIISTESRLFIPMPANDTSESPTDREFCLIAVRRRENTESNRTQRPAGSGE